MTRFPAYASGFQLHPQTGAAFEHLSPLLGLLKRVPFDLRVDNISANQGQVASDFDPRFEQALHELGATRCPFCLPDGVPQELDFAFTFAGRTVAVEIEKSNREKILRDILKCHMCLHAGADFALVALPRNYAHRHGIWNLFEFGVQRFNECRMYGFGTPERFGRILLLGFDQFDMATNELLSQKTRQQMRVQAAAGGG